MSELIADYIVVGSGLSGVHAAQTIAEAGHKLLLLDVGEESSNVYHNNLSFLESRIEDQEQYKYWLGEDLSGLPKTEIGTGSQLTPSRRQGLELSRQLAPFLSADFQPMENLAKGGLGIAWGLGCCAFSETELKKASLPVEPMKEAYNTIAKRIGISYTPDDVLDYTMPGIEDLQSGISIDANSEKLLLKYGKTKKKINSKGFFLGKPSLALLTREKDGRHPNNYGEMDFYESDSSAYRPAITLELLNRLSNFRYLDNHLVTHFEELEGRVRVHFINTQTRDVSHYDCRKLILACNVLGTARIVLRSKQQWLHRLPVLCNPYSYVPCLQWRRLGKLDPNPRTATAQLFLFHDPGMDNADVAMASLYSYRSLLIHRVINQSPLNAKDSRLFFQYLLPAMTIAGIHQPDELMDSKQIWLEKKEDELTKDVLKAVAGFSKAWLEKINQREKKFLRCFRQLGCIPLKKINPGYGSSIHYAGTLPYSQQEKPFHLLPGGKLGQSSNIYIADGSGFAYLPAKGISFSLMANAHRTAINAMQND